MNIQSKRQILAQLIAIDNKLMRLYGNAYAKAINLSGVIRIIEAGEDDFDWDKHPDVRKQIENIMTDLSKNVSSLIGSQTGEAHSKAEKDSAKAIVKSVGGYDVKSLSRGAQQVMDEVTEEHRDKTAKTAKERDLRISERVWNYNSKSKEEIRIIIQNGIKQGMSADDMTASLKGYLQNPDKLFRRVRNKETGLLELSKAAQEYNPGRGVYRSAYKNALRLARTEVNMAYRQAEWQTYQDNPLIKAYEIRLSNNHTTPDEKTGKPKALFDVCDRLAGVYPKQFKWTGWHPQCRCMMIPITLSPKEFGEYTKAKQEGKLAQWKLKQPVVEMPRNFMDWINENSGRINRVMMRGGSIPFFLRDNFKDGDINKGLAFDIVSDAERLLMAARERQEARTPEQIEDIKRRWAEHQRIQEEVKKIMDRENTGIKGINEDLERYPGFIRKNLEDLSKGIGQERGLSMSYDDANHGKENPLYPHKHVSKNSEEYGYTVNCQTCTVVHELRRRGFDVEAVPNEGGKSVWKVYDKYGIGHRKGKWLSEDGKPVDFFYASDWAKDKGYKAMTVKRAHEFLEEMMHNDGRFEICCDWKGKGAHVFLAERVEGKIKFFDPQSGREGVFEEYVGSMKLGRIGVIRIDNKMIDPRLSELFIPKGNAKAPRKEITYQEAYEIFMKEGGRKKLILEDAKRRHESRTPEEIAKIKEHAKMLNDRWAEDRFIKRVADIGRVYMGDESADALLKVYHNNKHNESLDEAKKMIKNIRKHVRHGRLALADAEAFFKGSGNDVIDMMRKALADKKIDGINAAVKAVNDEIYKAVKQYDGFASKDELMKFGTFAVEQAKKAVDNKISQITSGGSLDWQKKKFETEILYVEYPNDPMFGKPNAKRYDTWEITKRAYQKALKDVEVKIEWQSFDSEFAILKQYSGQHKSKQGKAPTKIEALVNEIESIKANGGSIEDAKLKLAQANDIKKKNESSVKSQAKAKAAKDAKKAADLKAKIEALEKELDEYSDYITNVLSGKIAGDSKWNNYDDIATQKEIDKLNKQLSKLSVSKDNTVGLRLDDDAFFMQVERLYDKYYPKAITTDKKKALDDVLSAVKAKDRSKADSLLKGLGYDMDDPYGQARRDSANWSINPSEGNDFMYEQSNTRSIWKSISYGEKASLVRYTEGSSYITEPLRAINGHFYAYKRRMQECAEDVENMTNVIDKCNVSMDMWVKRDDDAWNVENIFGIKSLDAYKNDPSKLVGLRGVDDSFESCAYAKDTYFGSKGVVFNIYAPKGTKMIYTEPFSYYGKDHSGNVYRPKENWDGDTKPINVGPCNKSVPGLNSNENEVILQRGTEFEIIKAEYNDQERKWYIDMAVKSQNPKEIDSFVWNDAEKGFAVKFK